MKINHILSIILLLFLQTSYCQKSDEFNYKTVQNFISTFFKHINKSELDKAYSMLGEEIRESESKYEFKLYFENIIKYYGKIINFKPQSDIGISLKRDEDSFFGSYKLKFSNTKADIIFTFKNYKDNKLRINNYLLMADDEIKLEIFYKILKKPLKYLKERNYKALYELIPRYYHVDTFDEFLAKIKKLEINEKLKYEQKSHEISVVNDKVYINIRYEINKIGDIIFEYKKEGDQIKLLEIRFHFTKEINDKYKADLYRFIDTTSLRKDEKLLLREDSLRLKKEFDRILEEKRDAEIAKLLEESKSINTNENLNSVGIAYDWNQIEENQRKLIKTASEKYLNILVKNDIEEFWKICHSQFKANIPLASFKNIISPISKMINSDDNLEFIDGKRVNFLKPPKTSQLTTSGSLDKSKATYLEYYSYPNIKDQALTIYKLNAEKLSRKITIRLGLEDSSYKLLSFEINLSSVQGKNTNYYYRLSKKWDSNNSFLPKFIALNMAYKLSSLGNGIASGNNIKIKAELDALMNNKELLAEIENWSLGDADFNIINIDFLETMSDISLNIKYVSQSKLEKSQIEKETESLFKYLKRKYPKMVNEFNNVMFTAYEEYPDSQFRKYEYYRTIKYAKKQK